MAGTKYLNGYDTGARYDGTFDDAVRSSMASTNRKEYFGDCAATNVRSVEDMQFLTSRKMERSVSGPMSNEAILVDLLKPN